MNEFLAICVSNLLLQMLWMQVILLWILKNAGAGNYSGIVDTGSVAGGGYAGGIGINVGAENAGDSGTSMRQQMVVMERVWILLLEKQDIVQNHTKRLLC